MSEVEESEERRSRAHTFARLACCRAEENESLLVGADFSVDEAS